MCFKLNACLSAVNNIKVINNNSFTLTFNRSKKNVFEDVTECLMGQQCNNCMLCCIGCYYTALVIPVILKTETVNCLFLFLLQLVCFCLSVCLSYCLPDFVYVLSLLLFV